MINTSGGLTGGDRLDIEAQAGAKSALTLTTQAAERAYRAKSGMARVRNALTVAEDAMLSWLPQELILFDGARLMRELHVDLAVTARFLMVEPVIFGRAAMGEQLRDVVFHDRIRIYRAGQPLYFDGTQIAGDLSKTLSSPALAREAGAMTSLLYVAPDAESHLTPLRAIMGREGGVSLLRPDVLALRLLAPDSHLLRRALLPALDRLTGDRLPTSWRL